MKVGFFYFVPCERHAVVDEHGGQLDLEGLKKFGLDYVFRDRAVHVDQTITHYGAGPGGGTGTLLYPRPYGEDELPDQLTYSESAQEWIKFRQFWIGRNRNAPLPGPEELCRAFDPKGVPVNDQFGQDWRVPIIIAKDPSHYCFPTELCFDTDGNVHRRRRATEDRLWDVSGILRDHIKEIHPISDMDLGLLVAEVMGVYYRLGPAELVMLDRNRRNPIDSDFINMMIWVLLEGDIEREHVEKKTPEGEEAHALLSV